MIKYLLFTILILLISLIFLVIETFKAGLVIFLFGLALETFFFLMEELDGNLTMRIRNRPRR